MMRKIYLLLALTMMMVQGAWAQGLSGNGTSADPYRIENNNDWSTFAASVTNGNTYEGKYVNLMSDINASGIMVGDMSHPFQGTFDGNSNTITFNKGTSASPFAEDYCAPFRMVTKATIKNLKTEGTIYTNENYAAGIVAQGDHTRGARHVHPLFRQEARVGSHARCRPGLELLRPCQPLLRTGRRRV